MEIELIIQNGDKVYLPAVIEGISWTTERSGVAGQLSFSVLYDDLLDIVEGNAVRLTVDETGVFYGFIFTRTVSKSGMVNITAYDQLRYLKNKDTYVYSSMTAGQFVNMLADDFMLNVGEIADTGYIIPSRVEENTTLFDMIINALDLTLTNSGEMFVLFDDFGKLSVKNITDMAVGILIDNGTGSDFSYSSSIDGESYNKIKLTYDNEETGVREIYISQDSDNINNWGILQYFDTLSENENGGVKADSLLNLYNTSLESLSVNGCFGDNRVRAGSSVVVQLDIMGKAHNSLMLVEKCKHTYKESLHTMDLELRGGGLNA